MSNEQKSFWTTLPGILTGIAAVITAIVTLYIALNSSVPLPEPYPEPYPPDEEADLIKAEKLTGDWLAAFQNQDVDALVQLADTPFFFDQEILMSANQVRESYLLLFEGGNPEPFKITSLKAKTIYDLKNEGYDVNQDRIISSLRLNDDDIAVIVMVEQEGIMFVFRRVNDDIRMAGFWD